MQAQDILTTTFFVTVLTAGIRLATPVLLAALGEVFNEQAGILNVGIEGMMLLGALGGFLGAFYSGSPWIGALTATLVGLVAGLLLAWMYISVQVDQVVCGIVFNIFAVAFSSLFYRALLGVSMTPPQVPKFEPINLPVLSDIPILGPILFHQIVWVYLVLAVVLVAQAVLFRFKAGLSVRATGEHPRAADTAGVSVTRVRYLCMLFASAMAGLAGGLLVLGALGIYRDNVTAGRGFIALAIVIVGRWSPVGALVASLAFGTIEALAVSLQMFQIPIAPQFLLMLPYLTTAIVMSGLLFRRNAPAALMKPYSRD